MSPTSASTAANSAAGTARTAAWDACTARAAERVAQNARLLDIIEEKRNA